MPRSTRSAAVVALVLALFPSLAMGQGYRHEQNVFDGKPAPVAPVSVAKAILDHEQDKELALSDTQRTALVVIQRQLDSLNAPYLHRLDSLRPTWRPAGGLGDVSEEQREQLLAFRAAEIATVDSVTPNIERANERARAVLRPQQRDRAEKFEKDARKRAEEAAKREFESRRQYERPERRRGDYTNGPGGSPVG